MEQQIISHLPNFKMFDYKVNYENHSSFTNEGKRKRKFGSPVRIFTNISLSELNLEGISGYKFCKLCYHWVSNENKHCDKCNACTSKDGRTYIHCLKCLKCVKPSYKHCDTCSKCALPTHNCQEFNWNPNCYHCLQPGHKRNECPSLKDESTNSNDELGIPKKKKKI